MSLTAVSGTHFLETCFPNWFARVPLKTDEEQKIQGNWCIVELVKKDEQGNIITDVSGNPLKHRFFQEISTGDLYYYDRKFKSLADLPVLTALKASAMIVGIPFYLFGMVIARTVKMCVDITRIFWKTLQQSVSQFSNKSFFASVGDTVMALCWEMPTRTLQNLWCIARSPIYAVGMQMAALFTVLSPLEGRKWLGKIEEEWHESVSYRRDVRHRVDFMEISFSDLISSIEAGKILYLGYCMAKRGNINDKVSLKVATPYLCNRYELYKESNATESKISKITQWFSKK